MHGAARGLADTACKGYGPCIGRYHAREDTQIAREDKEIAKNGHRTVWRGDREVGESTPWKSREACGSW
eukprot:2646901-Rhodomonas_salina.3